MMRCTKNRIATKRQPRYRSPEVVRCFAATVQGEHQGLNKALVAGMKGRGRVTIKGPESTGWRRS